MDGIRGEVSNKIRSAIKAKLMELGAYVDDELPDYIMVMVANKRSRQQMEEDLQLFLGDSTSTFTAWLHTVLSKLQQVTVNNTDIKKGSEKKRPSTEEHKKEKRKKIKKEKDKLEKTPERGKEKERAGEEKDLVKTDAHFSGKPIKSEPVDLIIEESVLLGNSIQPNSQSAGLNSSVTQQKKPAESRTNEEEDDEDFINLKADVEADMWGEADETVASKAVTIVEFAAPLAVSTELRSLELPVQETLPDQSKQTISPGKIMNTVLPDEVSASVNIVPSKHVKSKPAPHIIRISETIRQEQETLKPASKVVRDPQQGKERPPPSPIFFSPNASEASYNSVEKVEDDSEIFGRHIAHELRKLSTKQRKLAKLKIQQALAKRVFQSHIVSLKNAQDKPDNSRRRSTSSHLTDSHSRRNEQRVRKHEHEDLRETLRKERQRERGHGRDRERERRRSRDQNQMEKSQASVSGVPRSPLSHKDENGPDQAVSSVVRVKPRPQIPAALQANRSLILKAVAEAQKSVSKVVIRSELVNIKSRLSKKPLVENAQVQRQSTVKIQGSSKKGPLNSKQSARLPSRDALKKMSFTVLGTKAVPSKESLVAEFGDVSEEGSIILDPSLNILIQVPASPAVDETGEPQDPIQTEKVRRWIKDVEEATKSGTTPPVAGTDLGTDGGTEMDTFAGVECASKHGSDDEFDDALEVDTNSLKTSDIHSVVISEDQPLRQSRGTQFVVTLDGLDPRLLRSFALEGDALEGQADNSTKHQEAESLDGQNLVDEESLMSEELVKEQLLREELLRQQAVIREQKAKRNSTIASSPASVSLNPPVKRPASPSSSMEARPPKVITTQAKNSGTERCKFWPSCKNGDKCEFHHPSVPCKLFPNCKFSDRCLYIHPNCRFNTACTRADCPYTHSGQRSTHSTPPSGTNHISQTIKQACKYFPNCSNLSCPYIHPTVCKFGTHCTRPKCQFIHSDKGLITKHKWVRH